MCNLQSNKPRSKTHLVLTGIGWVIASVSIWYTLMGADAVSSGQASVGSAFQCVGGAIAYFLTIGFLEHYERSSKQ